MTSKQLTPQDLRVYQRRAVRFMLDKPRSGMFLDMGLGKTISVLSTIKALKHAGQLTKPFLIVAPLRVVYTVWRQEAAHWRHTRGLTFSIVHGKERTRRVALEEPADVYLINPEGVRWLVQYLKKAGMDNPEEWPFQGLVVDESTAFKSPKTRRFKALRDVSDYFQHVYLLTGTPAPNSLQDLWAQIYLLDGGQRLGTSFLFFRDRFFEKLDYNGYEWGLRAGAERRINELLRDIVLRLSAEDWLALPPVVRNRVNVRMPEDKRALYAEFETHMFMELDNADVEAISAAALTTRCQQFANGAVFGEERETGNRTWTVLHDAKIEALHEIMEEAGGPVLVAYKYKHDLARLQKAFPQAPVLGGGSMAKNQGLIDDWNAKRLPMLLVHPASAGHGLNLQEGGYTLVFFSLTWSLEQHDQLIGRLQRSGQRNNVIVHYIVTEETVDEAIMLAIDSKATTQRRLLDALKEYREHTELLGN